ncbi:MAG TPA: KUP/HAK/KT family potassium transporter [Kineosporiaceae bacterium]|nr:KUP/HAK/KT family potassium transporter [Kineosporiaceae bacterium]
MDEKETPHQRVEPPAEQVGGGGQGGLGADTVAAASNATGRVAATSRLGAGAAVRWSLVVAALGVVFGDIGTSPIYTMATVFNPADPHPVTVARVSIFGVASLIFWSLTIIVTIKYVLLVMRADNDGEGGILALITLIRRTGMPGGRRTKRVLAALGVFGAALFLGDSMITPAISVLSAVEGLKVVQPSLGPLVVPLTVVVIIVLFISQRFGTAAVGRLFGPVMLGWFAAIGACGVGGIAQHPSVVAALSPTYAVAFFRAEPSTAFFSLAGVVLAITGAEALYADLGHFGRPAITRAWLWLVLPACVLSYLGQGALLLNDPANAVASPFFLLTPQWARSAMVVLATAATIIASQAVISGAFSLTHQAVQLGYLPRLRITHTSDRTIGQIYVPFVNWTLMVAVILLVVSFESSAALAYAFGMAVTLTITITTLLFFYIVRNQWHRPLWLVVPAAGFFLAIEGLFVAANLTKFTHGAWLPLLIGVVAFVVMTTWQLGRALVTVRRRRMEGPLQEFVDRLHDGTLHVVRAPGTAVHLNRGKETTPLALRAIVTHTHVLAEQVVILSLETLPVPYIADDERITLDDLHWTDDPITHVSARYGYMEDPDAPRALQLAVRGGLSLATTAPEDVSWFLSTIDLHVGPEPGMPRWRKLLFVATSRITADAAQYFHLPRDQTVIVGSRIDV